MRMGDYYYGIIILLLQNSIIIVPCSQKTFKST